MSVAARSALWASLFCIALPMAAQGQSRFSPVPFGTSPSSALPDTAFRDVGDRPVVLTLNDGTPIRVRILIVEPERLIIRFLYGGQVMTLPRAKVMAVNLFDPATYAGLDTPAAPAPPRRLRYVGASFSFLPGFTLDLDVRRFHAFANVGILLAGATQGGIVPVSIGLGAGLPLWPDMPGLKLDLFTHVNFVGDTHGDSDTGFHTGNWLAFGVGLGLHHTWDNGLTLGFALPVFGYSFLLGRPLSHVRDLATGFGYYYATSGEALPAFYVGYRMDNR